MSKFKFNSIEWLDQRVREFYSPSPFIKLLTKKDEMSKKKEEKKELAKGEDSPTESFVEAYPELKEVETFYFGKHFFTPIEDLEGKSKGFKAKRNDGILCEISMKDYVDSEGVKSLVIDKIKY